MDQQIKPKFLPNSPIGKDLFEGQSQEKIASVLTDILSKDDFQIMGIDGGWGTGKSNLVKIVESKLPSHHFFVYDVWGHQEDDQRRSILVELTEFICNKERKLISDKGKWDTKYRRLLSKEKEVTTINRPYLSIGFILSLLLIIYVPSVTAFAKDMDFGLLKIGIVLAPIMIVIVIFLIKVCNLWSVNSFGDSIKMALQETFQIYNNKQTDETKTETISENEPSVKDFRNWMADIDADLGKHKLVLVFDNFDRLPKKNILSIWSSIHIFFSEEKYNNIKVIVPFDRLHIKNAFKDLNGDKNDYANDYINKTFDLVYRVSPPILSDWKIFFRSRWQEAFGDTNEYEYIKVEQIYEVFRLTITPREIIAFINEVVSIKLLDNTIPERYLALFVINKETILADPLKAIIEADFLLGLTYLYKDDDDFQKYITALAYQIDPENALEVVYRKQLKDSLVNKNTERFLEISKTNVFNKIIVPILSEIENYQNPILVLNSLDESSKLSQAEATTIWDNLFMKIRNEKTIDFSFEDYQRILLLNIAFAHQENYLKNIVLLLQNHSDFDASKFAEIIDLINDILNENRINIDIFELLKEKTVPVENLIPLVNHKKGLYKDYKIKTLESELIKYLLDIPAEKFEDALFVEFLQPDYNLVRFEDILPAKVEENATSKENLKKILKVFKLIASKTIGILLTDDQIYTLFSSSNEADGLYYDLVAMRLARGNDFSISYRSLFVAVMDSTEKKSIAGVAECVEFYLDYEHLLLNSLELTTPSTLYEGVAREIVENDYNTNHAEVSSLLEKFEEICTINKLDPQVFITDLDGWKDYEFETEFITSLDNYYFKEAVKSETELAKTTLKILQESFETLDTAAWTSIFADLSGSQAELLQIIGFVEWNSYALEALKQLLISTVQTGNITNPVELSRLILSFENSDQDLTNTFKDLRDELILNRNSNPELFNYFSPGLFTYGNLNERAGDVLRTIFKTSLLDDANSVGIILNKVDLIKNLMENTSENNFSDLKEAIRDRFDNDQIANIGRALGIRKRKEKEE